MVMMFQKETAPQSASDVPGSKVTAVTAAGENTSRPGSSLRSRALRVCYAAHARVGCESSAELLQEHVTGAKKAGLYCWNAQFQGMSRLPLSELLEVSKNQDLPVFRTRI